ncbi:hypothetical protein CEXT_591271 [Caerostris extrusa]|uniref:Uncharacterized protein n=1 Tax=Caerostris extrusa TaxID=172846 RepID=A0AAV4MTB9_CAEEX|nr:hypothetical protein CEXT_591271 [Caerostris extrusa]
MGKFEGMTDWKKVAIVLGRGYCHMKLLLSVNQGSVQSVREHSTGNADNGNSEKGNKLATQIYISCETGELVIAWFQTAWLIQTHNPWFRLLGFIAACPNLQLELLFLSVMLAEIRRQE